MHTHHASCIPERYRQIRDLNPTLHDYLPRFPLGNYMSNMTLPKVTDTFTSIEGIWVGVGRQYGAVTHS